MNTKKALIVIGIIILFFFITNFPWIYLDVATRLSPNPPKPEITYGEFPFKLVYELNGEQITVEDTVICEYDGVGMYTDNGKFRKWKKYLANSGGENVLIISDKTRKIYCGVGKAEYYMGDYKYTIDKISPNIYDVKLNPMDRSILSQKELLEKYKIKIISFEYTEPIENSFK